MDRETPERSMSLRDRAISRVSRWAYEVGGEMLGAPGGTEPEFVLFPPGTPTVQRLKDCTCLGSCRGPEGLGSGWRCVLGRTPKERLCVSGCGRLTTRGVCPFCRGRDQYPGTLPEDIWKPLEIKP